MAFVETEYQFSAEPGSGSVEMRKTLEGYALYPSHEFDPMVHRVFRCCLAAFALIMGISLTFDPSLLMAGEGVFTTITRALGLYLIGFGIYWAVLSVRRAPELSVDLKNRALHLVSLNWRGFETSRKTIRFEEVTDLRATVGASSVDMRWQGRGWDMGRIELVWRKNHVTRLLTGDIGELELLLPRLRRDLGLY